MARRARLYLPEVTQHVVQRGNNREPCFFAEQDYHYYLECVADAAKKFNCQVHAYVLMTNHVHLLLTPGEEYAVSGMMQSVGRKYVRYVNHAYKRTGTLWEGRFKAGLVQSEHYVLACSRYIELNPVRALMVDTPDAYKWSSYRSNAWGEPDKRLHHHYMYTQLGSHAEACLEAYRELFRHHIDHALLHQIRDAVNQESILGSSYFKDKIESVLKHHVNTKRIDTFQVVEGEVVYGVC